MTWNFRDTLISRISRFFQNREITECREIKKKCGESLLPRKLSDVILKITFDQLRLLWNVI